MIPPFFFCDETLTVIYASSELNFALSSHQVYSGSITPQGILENIMIDRYFIDDVVQK